MLLHRGVCLFLTTLTAAACFPDGSDQDRRLVRVRWVPADPQGEALGGTRSVQLAAAQVEGGQVVEVFTGSAVDPRSVQTLSVAVPKDVSVNLFVQTPRGNAGSLGQLVGLVQWADPHAESRLAVTSRLRASTADVDLGEPTFSNPDPHRVDDNRLTVAAANNPLKLSDRDGDGISDLEDDDDDGDGILDHDDPDMDGDMMADVDQELSALTDRNGANDGDGVPDDLE